VPSSVPFPSADKHERVSSALAAFQQIENARRRTVTLLIVCPHSAH
jgi:hypothetical protein